MSEPDYSLLQRIKIWLGLRDNEYDTGKPGPSRPLTGLFSQLTPEQQRAAVSDDPMESKSCPER
jgi:hypothetical protein